MMKTLMMISTAAGALMLAGAASAQVVGGNVAGNVTGNVGVQTPPVGGMVNQTVREGRMMTRDTVRDAREAAQTARPEVSASAQANAQADADGDDNSASLSTALTTGAMVHVSDGAMLGTVTEVTRDAAGRATAFTYRTAQGANRTAPTAGVSLDGGAVVIARPE